MNIKNINLYNKYIFSKIQGNKILFIYIFIIRIFLFIVQFFLNEKK